MQLLINVRAHGIVNHNSIELSFPANIKIKRTKERVMYYSNHTTYFNLSHLSV